MAKKIDVSVGVLDRNNAIANEVKSDLTARGICLVNLLGFPGSGKTTLLEALVKGGYFKGGELVVIEGDLYTDQDALRMKALGVQSVQINTQGACHLEADSIKRALGALDLEGVKVVVIDNVGNLVCTSEFLLGEHIRVGVSSVTEGNDKPTKYPLMFQSADVVVLNKVDLVPYTNFDVDRFVQDVRGLNEMAPIVTCSALQGQGIGDLVEAMDVLG